jgi:hypothetical protein
MVLLSLGLETQVHRPDRAKAGGPNPGHLISSPLLERAMATVRELSAIAKRQLALRDQLWPAASTNVWHRSTNKGYTTIPKTMPMILKIMDEMTKGAPVSSTFLTLWCSTWDNSFVTLSKVGEMANASGFGGQRGEHTWASRMRRLHELNFIDIKAGRAGPMSHAIIWNPHFVIRWHHQQRTPGLSEASYTALLEWALEIGAKDVLEETPLSNAWLAKDIRASLRESPDQASGKETNAVIHRVVPRGSARQKVQLKLPKANRTGPTSRSGASNRGDT